MSMKAAIISLATLFGIGAGIGYFSGKNVGHQEGLDEAGTRQSNGTMLEHAFNVAHKQADQFSQSCSGVLDNIVLDKKRDVFVMIMGAAANSYDLYANNRENYDTILKLDGAKIQIMQLPADLAKQDISAVYLPVENDPDKRGILAAKYFDFDDVLNLVNKQLFGTLSRNEPFAVYESPKSSGKYVLSPIIITDKGFTISPENEQGFPARFDIPLKLCAL